MTRLTLCVLLFVALAFSLADPAQSWCLSQKCVDAGYWPCLGNCDCLTSRLRKWIPVNCNVFTCNCDWCGAECALGDEESSGPPQPALSAFEKADTNGDEEVSRDEFEGFIRSGGKEIASRMNAPGKPEKAIDAQEMFSSLDSDQDGMISKKEAGCAE